MTSFDKVSMLKKEKAPYEERQAYLEKLTSENKARVSDLQGQEKSFVDERSDAQKDYKDALEQPHEKLEQLMEAQDRMAAADAKLEMTQSLLGDATQKLQTSIGEEAKVAAQIDDLNTEIEATQISNSPEGWKTGADWVERGIKGAGVVAGVDVPDEVTEAGGKAYIYQKAREEDALEAERALHEKQLVEVADLKSQLQSGMAASKAEIERVMGSDMSIAAQKEFHNNEFSNAFHQANELIGQQLEERAASSTTFFSFVEQQQERAGMNQELHAAHYDLTRGLAEQQAEINVGLGNEQMNQLEEQRLARQGVPPEQMSAAMEPLAQIQEEQRALEISSNASLIHAENCPALSQNPPALEFMPGSQQGPGTGPPPQGL